MPDLINSQRHIPKATYVPLVVPSSDQSRNGRAVEKAAFLRNLDPQNAELADLATHPGVSALTVATAKKESSPPLLDVVRDFAADTSADSLRRHGARLARASFDDLATLGAELAKARRARATEAAKLQHADLALLDQRAALTEKLVQQFNYVSPITPVGQLHLERLEMTPVGVEHGELVHSVPLAPNETVNVAHREWSVTSQTFENISEDSLEGFSETGVAEKSDLAQATDSEAKHSSSLDVNGAVSATYNGGSYSITASAAVGYKSQSDTQESEKRSIAHSMAVTRLASTRSRKEHKTSFRVSSVAGAENMAVQVITNPSDTKAMRVDYYQLLRKWRVDLIRYGLRMTYDIVVPNPGFDLTRKLMELQDLNQTILAGNTFSLDPTAIQRANWMQFEKNFGASVDPPPTAELKFSQVSAIAQATMDKWGTGTIQFDVPEGYAITAGHFRGFFSLYSYDPNGRHLQVDVNGEPNGTTNIATGEYEGADALLDFDLTAATLVRGSGTVYLLYQYHNVDFGEVVVTITAEPTDEMMQKWQGRVWSQLREADQANYEARLVLVRDRKAQLESEIGAFDALTLRKMEREEVMRAVLQWLLGPNFTLMPGGIATLISSNDPRQRPGTFSLPEVNTLDASDWQNISQSHGELIKYLHNAVEWENVVFFAYPYFWDAVQNWPFNQFLIHPDPIHRQFLRGGCARAVLPVRPGFETSFAMLMETGDATAPPDTTFPYVSIGEELRNYAMTNYEGIPPANPDHNVRTLLYPQQRKAWADLQTLIGVLAQCKEDTGAYPPNLADAEVTAAATKLGVTLPGLDPWGRPYVYTTPGVYGDYDLASYGADGKPGGTDLDADVTSWAEGSIVGRWFEYTPTSALDIAVNMIAVDTTPLPTTAQPA